MTKYFLPNKLCIKHVVLIYLYIHGIFHSVIATLYMFHVKTNL